MHVYIHIYIYDVYRCFIWGIHFQGCEGLFVREGTFSERLAVRSTVKQDSGDATQEASTKTIEIGGSVLYQGVGFPSSHLPLPHRELHCHCHLEVPYYHKTGLACT